MDVIRESSRLFSHLRFAVAATLVFTFQFTGSVLAQQNTAEVRGEAVEAIADYFDENRKETEYFLRDKNTGRNTKLYFRGAVPASFKSGNSVRIKGRKRSDGIEVEQVMADPSWSSSTANNAVEAPVALPVNKRILTILVDFNDATVAAGGYGTTVPAVANRMFNETKNVEGLLYNASLGTMTIDEDVDGDLVQDVFGPYQINANYLSTNPGSCNATTWVNQASAAWIAANPGKNILDWQHRLFILPNYRDNSPRHCGWGGYAQVGCGTWCWALTADPDTIMHGVIIHELGHNFGLRHARTDLNNNGYDEAEPTDSEYGDDSDLMGGSRNWMKFNPPHAEDQGWVDPIDYEIRDVTVSPTITHFDLIPIDEEVWTWPGLRSLKIDRDVSTQYYFSWRQQVGDYNDVTAEYTDGVSVHYGFTGSTTSYFVRTVQPGETFIDQAANLILAVKDTMVVTDSGNTTTVIGVDVCTLDCDTLPVPTGLAASGLTPVSIHLQWTDNAFTEDGYEIQRSPDGTAWSALDTVGANAVSYVDSGLSAGQQFWYRVRAFEGGNTSGWSNEDEATTPPAAAVLSIPINHMDDDVEEFQSDGWVYTYSSTINLANDNWRTDTQENGLRFNNVSLPQGATINSAVLRVVSTNTDAGNANVSVRVENTANAQPYDEDIDYGVTSRSYFNEAVSWNMSGWTPLQTYDSPNLASLVQQVTDRTDWLGDGSLAFKTNLVSGTGYFRVASYDSYPTQAAQLVIDYSWTAALNVLPTAAFSWSASDLDVGFTDSSTDSDGNIVSWSWDFGDTNTSTAQNPSHAYASAGTYSVQLTVTDDDGDSDSISHDVTVTEPVPECSETMSVAVDEIKPFALPCDPGGKTVAEVFTAFDMNDMGGPWAMYYVDNANKVPVMLAPDSVLPVGVFYAIKSNIDASVTVSGSNIPTMDLPLTSSAAGDWNMFGYTGRASLPWVDVIPMEGVNNMDWDWADDWSPSDSSYLCDLDPVDANCRVRRILHKWGGAAFEPYEPTGVNAGTLEPWDAFLVQAFVSGTGLQIPQTPAAAANVSLKAAPGVDARPEAKRTWPGRGNWREWHIRLTAESGRYKDKGNSFGRLKDSRDGQDGHDLEELPPFSGTYLTVLFDNPEFEPAAWGYSTDFRAAKNTRGGDWDFSVFASPDIGTVTLRWSGDGRALANATLTNLLTGETVQAGPGGSYTFEMAPGRVNRFRFNIK